MRKRWLFVHRISRALFGPGIWRVVVTPLTATVLDISALSTGATTLAGRERIASAARQRWATSRAARSAGHSRPYIDRGLCRK